MKNLDTLFALYTHLTCQDLGIPTKENTPPALSYYLTCVFSESFFFDDKDLINLYNEVAPLKMPDLPEGYIGPFESLPSLNQYAFTLMDRHAASKIVLISSQSFNEAIKMISSPSDFKKALLDHGNVIALPEGESKKGFLGKIFS